MAKYIDIEKLNSLIDNKLEDLGMSGSVWVGRSVLCELKDEIKSLQQEQPEVDLEKEIERWWSEEYMKNSEGLPILPIVQGIARHFAEWQSKQDKETIELAEDHAYLAGSVNEREKMMKEAVEGYATLTLTGVRTVAATIKGEDNIGPGDKVRVIVLKED